MGTVQTREGKSSFEPLLLILCRKSSIVIGRREKCYTQFSVRLKKKKVWILDEDRVMRNGKENSE